jgi:septum formation inhibitor MinC
MSEDKNQEVEKTTDSPASENKGNEVVVEKVDYKAELEKTKEQLKKAEFTIEKIKKGSESNTKKDNDTDIDRDIDAEIEERANKIAEATSNKVRQEMVQDTIDEEISKISESPEHAELIKLYYDKRIVKSGFSKQAVLDDINSAAILVNKPKAEAILKELKQKAVSNATKNGGGAISGHAENVEAKIELSAADRRIMERFGLKEEDINK